MAITKVTNSLVATNAIQGTLIADNAITSVHIAQNQVTSVQIPDSSITSTQLAANSVDTAELISGSIDAIHLASDSVTTAKILDANITTAKIANNAITSALIPDGSITDTQLGSGAFTMGNITTTGSIRGPASLTIDPATVGDNTGTVVIAGNLQVDGTTTTVNSTTLDVADKNITLGKGGSASANNGGGITIDGAAATLNYVHSGTKWEFNKQLDITPASGNTLQVQELGSTSIQLESTGSLRLKPAGGSTDLYYQSNEKLTTKADGVDITGELQADSLDIDGNADITGNLVVAGADHTFYSAAADIEFNIGRDATQKININVDDNNVKLIAQQDADGNSTHTYALDRNFAGTGANAFEIQKAGSMQLRVDTSGDVTIGDGDLYLGGGTGQTFIEIASGTSGAKTYRIYNGISWNPDALLIYNHTNDNTVLTIEPNSLGINRGASSLTHNLEVGGTSFFNGNVGIAKSSLTTWSSGYNALQVGGRGFVGAHSGSDLYVGQNASFNSGWKYQASVAASLTQHSGGKITQFVAPAGTAGNAISWNRAIDINPTGEVAIGLTPANGIALQLGNSANNSAITRVTNGTTSVDLTASSSGKAFLEVGTNHPLVFATNATERMRISSDGKVGIGTDDPAGPLHVDGHTGSLATILEGNGNGDTVPLHFRVKANNSNVTNHGIFGNAGSTGADNFIHIGPSSTSGISVMSTGKVGIGTNIASNKFGIKVTSINTDERMINLYTGTTGPGKYVSIGAQYSETNLLSNSEIRFGNEVQSNAPSFLAFATGNTTTPTERMRIDSLGFVHVGGSDANHKGLSLKYHAANDSYTPTAFNDYSLLRLNVANAAGNYAGITYTHNGGTEFFTGLVRVGATSDITDYVFQGYNGNSNAYQEYMRLTSAGELGIGLGGSAPQGKLEIRVPEGEGGFMIGSSSSTANQNKTQMIQCASTLASNNGWKDVAYIGHSGIFRIIGKSIQSGSATYGGAATEATLSVHYGSASVTHHHQHYVGLNGGDVTGNMEYRYLNSGATNGNYRLQVRMPYSGGSHIVYTSITGISHDEIYEDDA